ncbi:MAG: hypothetical protein V1860_01305 [bacterium]
MNWKKQEEPIDIFLERLRLAEQFDKACKKILESFKKLEKEDLFLKRKLLRLIRFKKRQHG